MVTIPDEVKALFSSDTVHKNFHVTFPNGETTDLNNEDVISESVKFTESLCSQQYFKFGLAEASQIEFIAVNVPNVRGAYIECAIEIDCTRLGAAWASAHPVDPALSFLTPQTCNYATKLYYRVPYGRFRIDTCPRDHGAMYQRKITAYSDSLRKDNNQDDFLTTKDSFFSSAKEYNPNVKLLAFSEMFKDNPEELDNYGFTKTVITPDFGTNKSAQQLGRTYEFKNTDDDTCLASMNYVIYTGVDGATKTRYAYSGNSIIATVGQTPYQYENAFKSAALSVFEQMNADPEKSGFSTMEELVADFTETCKSFLGQTAVVCGVWGCGITPMGYLSCKDEAMYPFRDGFGNYYYYPPIGFEVVASGGGEVGYERVDYDFRPPLVQYTIPTGSSDPLDNLTISITPTLTKKNGNNKTYSYANAYSIYDISVGYLEIIGAFLKPNRFGSFDLFQMSSNLTPVQISASDWAEFWWDETPISSIGQVDVIYSDGTEEQQATYVIGTGNSIYTIENNEVLKAANIDATTLESILTTYFAPNASVVNFTPVDLSMRGLPYLESGDYIELTAEDGETVDTYILSQTISGIQHLTAEITSTNGNLLEVIA